MTHLKKGLIAAALFIVGTSDVLPFDPLSYFSFPLKGCDHTACLFEPVEIGECISSLESSDLPLKQLVEPDFELELSYAKFWLVDPMTREFYEAVCLKNKLYFTYMDRARRSPRELRI